MAAAELLGALAAEVWQLIWPNVAGLEWCGIAEMLIEEAAVAKHLRKRRTLIEEGGNVFLLTNPCILRKQDGT